MIPPPQLGQRSPPVLELVDDSMSEIFLRVPPDDPATLARASVVCTAWRGIISDADFGRQYRVFHGAPPVLGFLHNSRNGSASHFVSTTASPAFHDRQDLYALDSRHGLVLFHTHHDSLYIRGFAVGDLLTHDRWSVPAPPGPEWPAVVYWNAAVLCADCGEGAFLVALVGSNDRVILASVYSSEAGEWSDTISIQKRSRTYMEIWRTGRSAVLGNKVYLPYGGRDLIAEYDLDAQELAVIRVPFAHYPGPGIVLVGAEADGMLLYAAATTAIDEPALYLWSMEPDPNGAARLRVIDLEPLLPHLAFYSCRDVSVAGFAEGAGVIFLEIEDGTFTVELSSCRSKKVHWRTFYPNVIPYESFYTGGHGERGRRAVVGATRRWTGLLWLYGENLQ